MTTKFSLDEKLVWIGLEANDSLQLLQTMADKLHEAGYVADSYGTSIIARERIFPTGLPTGEIGVAIPHTDICHVIKPAIAVGVLKKPVIFRNMGCPESTVDAQVVLMLAMKDSDSQIRILSQLATILQDEGLLKLISGAKHPADVLRLLDEKFDH
ncbi:phosphotransferase/anion transporter [Lucifera butyrica]|uniref:Phosphotransferase/anion transporter n=1 Tax=Lucifera butyrica TaxID=1351585 RepID=A0A498R4F1_9FIRM|nr:PTS sugar transporter subunit IIA [Lucifera butyrica]VBB07566.1 phosphotransferase/anion transporter [Lucifera butyrica]